VIAVPSAPNGCTPLRRIVANGLPALSVHTALSAATSCGAGGTCVKSGDGTGGGGGGGTAAVVKLQTGPVFVPTRSSGRRARSTSCWPSALAQIAEHVDAVAMVFAGGFTVSSWNV
jgi:hypothetical protein